MLAKHCPHWIQSNERTRTKGNQFTLKYTAQYIVTETKNVFFQRWKSSLSILVIKLPNSSVLTLTVVQQGCYLSLNDCCNSETLAQNCLNPLARQTPIYIILCKQQKYTSFNGDADRLDLKAWINLHCIIRFGRACWTSVELYWFIKVLTSPQWARCTLFCICSWLDHRWGIPKAPSTWKKQRNH